MDEQMSPFCLKLVDAEGGGELFAEEGAPAPRFVLVAEDGSRSGEFDYGADYRPMSDTLVVPDTGEAVKAPWRCARVAAGTYRVESLDVPKGWVVRDGAEVTLSPNDSTPIRVLADPAPKPTDDGSGRLSRAIDAAKCRLTKHDGAWVGCMLAALLISLFIVAPFAWMLAFSVIAAGANGFGPAFALSNMGDYCAKYFLNGWRAVDLVSAAYGSPLEAWGVALAAAAGVMAWAAPTITEKVDARRLSNPLLDQAPPIAGDNQFGSSRILRKPAELKEHLDAIDPDDPDLKLAGLVLGTMPEPLCIDAPRAALSAGWAFLSELAPGFPAPPRIRGKYATITDDYNAILFGGTRAGKTRRILLPTIHALINASEESTILLDPKGELWGLTSEEAIAVLGAENVVRIDLRSPNRSDTTNPLQPVIEAAAPIREGKKPDFDEMNRAAADVVELLMPADNDAPAAKFFNDGARAYVKTAILYVASDPTIPLDQVSVTSVCRILERYGNDRDENPNMKGGKSPRYNPFEVMVDKFPMDHPVSEAYATLRDVVDKERSQFITTALTTLRDWRDSNIASMTSTTTIPWKEVGLRRCMVYIIIPAEKDTYAAFARLFISQAYTALASEAAKHGNRLPYRVNMLCEEFGQVPAVEKLPNWLSSSLGLGIRWFLVMQSVGQVVERYGRDARGIILENCSEKLLIKTTDLDETGKLFSGLAGEYTCLGGSTSVSGHRFSVFKPNTSTSQSLMGRAWFSPADICTWQANYGTLMHFGGAPGCLLIPLPDVSRTPTTAFFDLGSKQHNAEKSRRALYGKDPIKRRPSFRWYFGIDKLPGGCDVRHSDADLMLAERNALMSGLQKKKAEESRTTIKPPFGALVSRDGAHSTPVCAYQDADNMRNGKDSNGQPCESYRRYRGWTLVEGGDREEVLRLVSEKKAELSKGKSSSAGPSGRDGGAPPKRRR